MDYPSEHRWSLAGGGIAHLNRVHRWVTWSTFVPGAFVSIARAELVPIILVLRAAANTTMDLRIFLDNAS
eukprot:4435503-Karenia_brevis.AAC.1